ncbi:unnamed protein product, partial [marine sediment metagenome]
YRIGYDPGAPPRNTGISACSYIYEFCGAKCSWEEAYTWCERKKLTMQERDAEGKIRFGRQTPIVRCFWHAGKPTLDPGDRTLNIAYDYNVYKSQPEWEKDVE